MADPMPCAHPQLGYLDLGQQRGWACTECGESGPTTVRATDMESKYGRVVGVMALCVCGSGWEWPATATGAEVARYLAGHVDCKEHAAAAHAAQRARAFGLGGGASEVQDAANYLLHRRETGNGTPRESTLRLTPASSDPLELLRDIRIDVSIDGNKVSARAIHEPTGTTVEAPGLGTALTGALRDCIAAVGRLHDQDVDGHQQAGGGDEG